MTFIRSRNQRRGSLTIEMILVVTVLAIVTVGIVQFGVFFPNADEVALAARVGAEEASQMSLPTVGAVPADVIRAIEHQLHSSKIDWAQIRLEHNNNPPNGEPVVLESEMPGFDCPAKTSFAEPPYPATHYVRLTVCVPRNDVFPKQLSFFGRQLFANDATYEHTVVMRHELTNP